MSLFGERSKWHCFGTDFVKIQTNLLAFCSNLPKSKTNFAKLDVIRFYAMAMEIYAMACSNIIMLPRRFNLKSIRTSFPV